MKQSSDNTVTLSKFIFLRKRNILVHYWLEAFGSDETDGCTTKSKSIYVFMTFSK